ncbi:hypothetical protein B0H13DRAFT_2332676 [Mycena leptocephala]|nr:hypothetical protein B0H13DRAFT_2332676 [Mycena leptocephala]
MLAAEAAIAALHPSAAFVSTASPETFKVTLTEEGEVEVRFFLPPGLYPANDAPLSLTVYTTVFLNSPVYNDLWAVRNVRPAFNMRLGVFGGVLYAGVVTMLRGRVPWTLRHHRGMGATPRRPPPTRSRRSPPRLQADRVPARGLGGAFEVDEGVGAADAEKSDKAEPEDVDVDVQETPARRRAHVHATVGTYAGLLQRACPVGVYQYVLDDGGRVIPGNSGNCIHCKLCDIKVPT